MKKTILTTIILLSLTGCLKNIFTYTAKPDTVTKNIIEKHHIQYLDENKKAKEWLSNSLSENFFIHIEIDKNENYEQIKNAILHAFDTNHIEELKKYYKKDGASSERILRSQKDVSHIRIKKDIKTKTLKSDKNVFYTVVETTTKLQYVKFYKKLGTADYKGDGTLVYKYGFIEPENSNKAYFYTNFDFNTKRNFMILRRNGNIVRNHIAGGEVYVFAFMYEDRDNYDYALIKRLLTLLKENQTPYKYISNEYKLVNGEERYKEISFDK